MRTNTTFILKTIYWMIHNIIWIWFNLELFYCFVLSFMSYEKQPKAIQTQLYHFYWRSSPWFEHHSRLPWCSFGLPHSNHPTTPCCHVLLVRLVICFLYLLLLQPLGLYQLLIDLLLLHPVGLCQLLQLLLNLLLFHHDNLLPLQYLLRLNPMGILLVLFHLLLLHVHDRKQ